MVGEIVRAEIGFGELALALIPTVNIVVLGAVYKLTGKVKDELVGQVGSQVGSAQEAIQTDLRNGIRERLDRVEQKLETMHLEKKAERKEP